MDESNAQQTQQLPHYVDDDDSAPEGASRFLLYALVGALVGFFVALLDWIVIEVVLHAFQELDWRWWAAIPGIGLIVSALILRVAWNTDSATSDLYVKAYHGNHVFERRRVLPKLSASITSVGFGNALGMEGPAIYLGTTIGSLLGSRRLGLTDQRRRRVLLAAGAAAGVAAIFRAPATGVLFALETPFRRDIARHALVPSLVASAASYTVFVLFLGTERLLPVKATQVTLSHEIFGAIVVGLAGGAVARSIALLFKKAKGLSHSPPQFRLPIAAGGIALAAFFTHKLVEEPAMLGPGAHTIAEIVLDQSISAWVIAALFCLRAASTSFSLAGGAVGGVFIPLVVQGLLLGRIIEVAFESPASGLFPVIALAAVLGSAYRTPLAAVMFVAETTGRSEFVIPALLATAISTSMMGNVSVTSGQVEARKGRLEHRLGLACRNVMDPMKHALGPDESLLEVVDRLDDVGELGFVPVCESEKGYVGLLAMADIALGLLEHGPDACVRSIMRRLPAVAGDALATEGAALMNDQNTAAVAVVDADNQPIGLLSATSLADLSTAVAKATSSND